ncbi:MAG TPA: histidine phosphatase family protein [Thermoanaerobaculia bacterium]|nr:histidine phosphatase family protein [Thermoanaerobaculia bacterium]
MIEQLVLVRHAETAHNVAGITQGWNDSALTERGERQIAQLARRLEAFRPTALFSSPLARALTTARAISEATGLEVETADELREMNYGSWENQSFLEVRRDQPDAYSRWIDDPDFACPGGESHNHVRERLERMFGRIATPRPVVVAHGTANRIAVTLLLNLSVLASRHFAQDNAAVNLFSRRADRWILKLWNDTSHCRDEAPANVPATEPR